MVRHGVGPNTGEVKVRFSREWPICSVGELRSLRYHNADILWQCCFIKRSAFSRSESEGLTEFVLESRQLRLGLIPKSFGRKSNR